jgi:hypothetical protein
MTRTGYRANIDFRCALFPFDSVPAYLVFDHGPQFNKEAVEAAKNFGSGPKRTSFRSHGRTALPSAGLAAAAAICSIASSASMNAT